MDKQKAKKNVAVSITFRIIILLVSLLARKTIISHIGTIAVGLDSLFSSIIGVLAISELGVGTAITFCMYRPIVENNTKTVSALYYFFKRVYTIIGAVIFLGGLIVMPFLPTLAKNYQDSSINIYFAFFLLLLSTVITYLFGCKVSLINAYKNNYITSAVTSSTCILRYLLQTVVVILTRSFYGYLACFLLTTVIEWIMISTIAKKKYAPIIENKAEIEKETKTEVVKNIKAMFFHKIGEVLVNSTDNIIISSFIGVAVLGKYSNYIAIISAMTGIIGMFFTPLVSVVGHACVENLEESQRIYHSLHKFNFLLGVLFFSGYHSVINSVITLFLGDNLTLSSQIRLVITVNYFVQFMRRSTLLYREASGTFYYDRWKPFVEGISNVILSVAFVMILPAGYRVVGVILATIITNLSICHTVEPIMLHKHLFHASSARYLARNFTYIAFFTVLIILEDMIHYQSGNLFVELLTNGTVAVAVFSVILIAFLITDKSFRRFAKSLLKK